ncbi:MULTISPECIES: hypothetical protein [Pseudomonas]|uniref:hypothetical protein n=1 Tax=Pseudomonas sp. MIL9 TaxID=2807620 RepID=UPI0019519745|nr:hypothetical protein [Pseudomonas sp. MIL9]MBM6447236.1 hypothetical protein [Pseudomonas sp. MIL9]
MFIQPHNFSSDLVLELDRQLTRLGAVAHVAVKHFDTPILVAIGQGFLAPVSLHHPTISSFVEAELIAARLNALQGIGDRQRITILRSMAGAAGH